MANKKKKAKKKTVKEQVYPSCPRCNRETFPMMGGGILCGTLACRCGWQQFR